MAQREIVIVGAGGFGRETVEAIRALNSAGVGWELLGYLDDDARQHGALIDGVPVLGGLEQLASMPDVSVLVCTGHPGDYVSRMRIVGRLSLAPERYPAIIHPAATVSTTSQVGPGSVVLAQTVLTASVTVGSHVAVMPHVTLTHDDVIEDFTTIASGVRLGGRVHVGRCAYIGAGAMVREHRTIGAGSLVGMGAVVTRNVPSDQVWAGVPARYIRPAAALASAPGAVAASQ